MSILIKNMVMPKNCYECRFGKEKQFDFGIVCTLLNGTTLDTTSRPKGICPLIELPAHGDLIDRDSVLEILSDKNAAWDGYVKVKALPIVVESEDGNGKD